MNVTSPLKVANKCFKPVRCTNCSIDQVSCEFTPIFTFEEYNQNKSYFLCEACGDATLQRYSDFYSEILMDLFRELGLFDEAGSEMKEVIKERKEVMPKQPTS